jgi:hypothetical protein
MALKKKINLNHIQRFSAYCFSVVKNSNLNMYEENLAVCADIHAKHTVLAERKN